MKKNKNSKVIVFTAALLALIMNLAAQTDIIPDIRKPDKALLLQPPDLIVESLSVPGEMIAGDSVTGHATVRNTGGSTAGRFNAEISMGGKSLRQFTDLRLEAGGSLQLDFTIQGFAAGNYTLTCRVIMTMRLPEANPNNNWKNASIRVKADQGKKPDLAIKSFSTVPAQPTDETPIVFVIEMINSGTANAVFRKNSIEIYVAPGVSIGWGPLQVPLAPGTVEKFASDLSTKILPAGTYQVKVQLDPQDQVREANETNNEKLFPLIVTAAPNPDLQITSVRLEPLSPPNGGPFTAVVTVKNTGSLPALFPRTAIVISGPGLAFSADSEIRLNAGETRVFRMLGSQACKGTWTFKVDPKNVLKEMDESNNSRSLEVQVQ
jgi:subtilase family serine protease